MAFWKKLFGMEKVTDAAANLIQEVPNALDKMFFTDEEKSDVKVQAMNLWLKMHEVAGDEQTARSVTRRVLAFAIIGEFLLLVTVMVIAKAFAAHDFAKFVFDTINEFFIWATGGIITFYFVPYGVSSVIKATKTKKEE